MLDPALLSGTPPALPNLFHERRMEAAKQQTAARRAEAEAYFASVRASAQETDATEVNPQN